MSKLKYIGTQHLKTVITDPKPEDSSTERLLHYRVAAWKWHMRRREQDQEIA